MDIEITVIDPNLNALEIARKRYEKMPLNPYVRSVSYHQNLPDLCAKIDLAIISTNADKRRKVIENLLDNVNLKYLILEKVAFQSTKDFQEISDILSKRNIKAWVNCPRRLYPFFRNLREETILSDSIKISITGKKWGLASNTIHMLDLFAFLSGQTKLTLNISELDTEICKSKRDGYIELTGKIYATTMRGDLLELVDYKKKDVPFQIIIEFRNKRLEIYQEQELIITYQSKIMHSKETFYMPLQSEMTASVVKSILEKGHSDLSSLSESYNLHCIMLDEFNKYLSAIYGEAIKICPIT